MPLTKYRSNFFHTERVRYQTDQRREIRSYRLGNLLAESSTYSPHKTMKIISDKTQLWQSQTATGTSLTYCQLLPPPLTTMVGATPDNLS